MISEIRKQIERIDAQIESETKVHQTWKKYRDCDIKTAVIHQTIGVVRGLETAKESLEYLLNWKQPQNDQMTTDEWFLHEQKMKGIMEQVVENAKEKQYEEDWKIVRKLYPNAETLSIEYDHKVFVNGEYVGTKDEFVKKFEGMKNE